MPTFCATASAVVRLSPVSMTMRSPSARSASRAPAVVGLIGSATPISPAGRPSTATNITVSPSARRFSALSADGPGSMSRLSRSRRLPSATVRPSTVPRTPLPVSEFELARVQAGRGRAPWRHRRSPPPADARSPARGSRPGAAAPPRPRPRPAASVVTLGLPSVSVPVLSTTSVSTLAKRSSASAFLIRTPAWAPRPVPTMIDIGVARPSAQGQAMIRTETAATRA